MNSSHHIIIVFIIALIGDSCSGKQEEERTLNEVRDEVVLIIDKCPDQNHIYSKDSDLFSFNETDVVLYYTDEDLVLHTYSTTSTPQLDTVVFPTQSEFIEVEHVVQLRDKLSYIFQKRDTILFTYDTDGFPTAQCLNRSVDPSEVNYEKVRLAYVVEEGEDLDAISQFEIDPIFSNPRLMAMRDISKANMIRLEVMGNLVKKAEVQYQKEGVLLDSLLENGKVSKTTYDFFYTKKEVSLACLKFQYDAKRKELSLTKEITAPPIWEYLGADSLMKYHYYQEILDFRARAAFYHKVPWEIGISKKHPSYSALYDTIKQSQNFTSIEKEVLLTKHIKLLVENASSDKAVEYAERYAEDIKNEALVKSVFPDPQQLLGDNNKLSKSIRQLQISDIEGNKLSFGEMLDKNRGKMIYVDMWASTCLPCLISIPYSKALTKRTDKDNVRILYVSIDRQEDAWKKAATKLGIYKIETCFLVDPRFLKESNISMPIPRYLIFDKQGKLAHRNAPDPRSEKVIALLKIL